MIEFGPLLRPRYSQLLSKPAPSHSDNYMCGIVGMFTPKSSPREEDIKAMMECVAHRGPDDQGLYCSGPVGLGHRRLSIIDLTSGRQPIFNENESVGVVFNGEIYNYQERREQLINRGHRFETDTDTEVIVHLYEEYGPEFVNLLDGMFAFALWDEDQEQLLLARDPIGVKPLHVALDGNSVAFGSELMAVLSAPVDQGPQNREAIGEYFSFGYIPAPKTAFTNVRKLEPGEIMVVDGKTVRSDMFYKPKIPTIDHDFSTATRKLRENLENAIAKRLMADVPLGAFLSGGIDSSIIVGLLSEMTGDTVRTFTIGFGESQFDETWAADAVSEYHGTDHHEYHISPSEVREMVPELVASFGEPFADPSILPTYLVARETRRDVTVALSGDGADELFSGYNKYRGEYYSKYYRAIPRAIRTRLVSPSVRQLPASRGTRWGDGIRMAQKFVRSADRDLSSRQYHWMAVATDDEYSALNGMDAETIGVERLREARKDATESLPRERRDSLSVIQMVDSRFALPNGILKKVDRASMLNSLEVRVPFLDTGVFEYAMGLPTNYSITATARKRILKSAFNDVLPREIVERGKQGFDIPIGEWFKKELASEFVQAVEMADTSAINVKEVKEIHHEHVHGARDHTNFLWAVYVFVHWLKNMERNGLISAE